MLSLVRDPTETNRFCPLGQWPANASNAGDSHLLGDRGCAPHYPVFLSMWDRSESARLDPSLRHKHNCRERLSQTAGLNDQQKLHGISALPSGVNPCNTTICPFAESATKMSPLGATARHRGFTKSLANTDTVNPGGTCGRKFARGRATTGPLSTRLSLDRIFARHPPILRARITAIATQAIKTPSGKAFVRISDPEDIALCSGSTAESSTMRVGVSNRSETASECVFVHQPSFGLALACEHDGFSVPLGVLRQSRDESVVRKPLCC